MAKELAEICKDIQTHMKMSRITDKNRGKHDFMGLYSQIFAAYRSSATSMFEIGVNRGGSIMMWRDYFSKAQVYGIDRTMRKCLIPKDERDRITILQLDQSFKEGLEGFGKKYGPFDVGIDDGSHVWSHQILTFETLWPYIKPGGTFVIEDVVTSYDAWVNSEGQTRPNRNYGEKHPSCMEYFHTLVDHLNFNGKDYETSPWDEFQRTIDWISFRVNVIVVKKKAQGSYDPC